MSVSIFGLMLSCSVLSFGISQQRKRRHQAPHFILVPETLWPINVSSCERILSTIKSQLIRIVQSTRWPLFICLISDIFKVKVNFDQNKTTTTDPHHFTLQRQRQFAPYVTTISSAMQPIISHLQYYIHECIVYRTKKNTNTPYAWVNWTIYRKLSNACSAWNIPVLLHSYYLVCCMQVRVFKYLNWLFVVKWRHSLSSCWMSVYA